MSFNKVFKQLIVYITEDQLELDLYKCVVTRSLSEEQRARSETKLAQLETQIKRNRFLMLLLARENDPINNFRN